MTTKLLEIEPCELKFTFELKKQSSCAIHLANISDHYVAYKVKTTSPKKYCVRPNIGIVKPKSTCDFTVTMQAQHSAPSDMQCKDKFLIQSTIAPYGTTEEDVTTGIFAKDSGIYVEESKLRVILVSPPQSPVLLPINGVSKKEPPHEASMQKDKIFSGLENLPPTEMAIRDVEDSEIATDMEELRQTMVTEKPELRAVKNVEVIRTMDMEPRPAEDVEGINLNLTNEIEELNVKVNGLNSKLIEAQFTIAKLNKEKSSSIQESESLVQELAMLRKKTGARRVQVGFPMLFVCMVALISLTVGYLLHR